MQVQPGKLVAFDLSGPEPAGPASTLKDILSGVGWAPDPGNEATWPMVSGWAK